jgi:tetratricopeptide (TPR) repeat protein
MPESVTNLVAKFQHQYGKSAESATVESPVVEQEMQVEPIQPATPVTEPKVVIAEETVVEEAVVEEAPVPSSAESVTTVAEESPEMTALAELKSGQADPVVEETTPQAVEVAPAAEEATPQVVAIAPAPMPQGIAAAGSVQKHELDEIVKNELIQAREAFWHRDLAKAETLYAELTAKQADNPDIWGELGNVYLAQNKVKEAADAYYKAAEILIDEGRLRQVGQLMGVIQMAEPAKAQALDQKIRKLYQQTGTMR